MKKNILPESPPGERGAKKYSIYHSTRDLGSGTRDQQRGDGGTYKWRGSA